jgi:endoglucanase
MQALPLVGLSRRALLAGLAVLGVAACAEDAPAAIDPGPPDTSLAVGGTGLGRGINLSWWLNLTGRLQPSDAELKALATAGFGHVRLPVDPFLLGWQPAAAAVLPPRIDRLDEAARRILGAGLDLIIDLHPGEELTSLLAQGDPAPALAALWAQLAARYAGLGPERVLFEIVNEPHRFLDSPAALARLHAAALLAIRSSCPRHRVLVNGLYDPQLSLRTIEPLADPGVIYAFQFYEPYAVTHQGADWDPSERGGVSALRGLPYPASRLEDSWGVAARAWFQPRALRLLMAYRRQGWDAALVDRRVAQAAAWSARHGRPVLCTEFGAMRVHLDAASRTAWLHDARSALERHGIPWTIWEYDGLFAVAQGCAGRPGRSACRALEPASLAALGLAAPAVAG